MLRSAAVARAAVELMGLPFRVEHITSAQNAIADALSRVDEEPRTQKPSKIESNTMRQQAALQERKINTIEREREVTPELDDENSGDEGGEVEQSESEKAPQTAAAPTTASTATADADVIDHDDPEHWRLDQKADTTWAAYWLAAEDSTAVVPAAVARHRPCTDGYGRLCTRDLRLGCDWQCPRTA